MASKKSSKLDQFMFKSSDSTRSSLYDILIQNLDFGINIKKIIGRRIDKHITRHEKKGFIKKRISSPGGGEMPFLNHANEVLLKGGSFTDTVKGWMTDNEQMLIESGGDGELRKSLIMAKELLSDIGKVKASLRSSLTYPIVLFIVLNVMIAAFAYSMLPILVSLSDPETWEGSSRMLYDFLIFFKANIVYLYLFLTILVVVILKTLNVWTGKIRSKFDSFMPWSVYKELNSGIFLISLSTLMKSGMTLITALESLRKQAPPYVRKEIELMIKRAQAAESNASSINTGFLGEIGEEIEDLAEFGSFEETVQEIGEKAVESISTSITSKGAKVKSIMLLFVFGFVGWGYGTFIAISQSITDQV